MPVVGLRRTVIKRKGSINRRTQEKKSRFKVENKFECVTYFLGWELQL